MSLLEKYLTSWRFRTSRPLFSSGDTVDVFISDHDGSDGIARVGDTTLRVDGAAPEHEGKQVRVTIDAFDPEQAAGRGTFEAVVGDSSYSG